MPHVLLSLFITILKECVHNTGFLTRQRFHDDLVLLKSKKRRVHNAILSFLAENAILRCPESQCPSDVRSVLRQLHAVESEFQAVSLLVTPKNPLNHAADVINGASRAISDKCFGRNVIILIFLLVLRFY